MERDDVEDGVVGVGGSSLRRRRARRLEALRLDLERADDVRRRQLAEHRRLSADVERAQTLLDVEEERLDAELLTGCGGSPRSSSLSSSSSDAGELSLQRLDVKSTEFPAVDRRRDRERDRGETDRRSDPDGRMTTSVQSPSKSPTPPGVETSGNDDVYAPSKTSRREISSDFFASDVASDDTGCGSLWEDGDLFIDGRRLTTLV